VSGAKPIGGMMGFAALNPSYSGEGREVTPHVGAASFLLAT
jgi:hypothetical protein